MKNAKKILFIHITLSAFLIFAFNSCATFPEELAEQRNEAEKAIQQILIENAEKFYCFLSFSSAYRGENERPGECLTYSSEFILLWNERYSHLGKAEIIFFRKDWLAKNGRNPGFGSNGRFSVSRTIFNPEDDSENLHFFMNDVINDSVIMKLYGMSTDRRLAYQYDRQPGRWPGHPYERTRRWKGLDSIDNHAWVFIDFGSFYASIDPYWMDLCQKENCRNCKGLTSYYKIDINSRMN